MEEDGDKVMRQKARNHGLELLKKGNTFQKRGRGNLRKLVEHIAEQEGNWSDKNMAKEVGYTAGTVEVNISKLNRNWFPQYSKEIEGEKWILQIEGQPHNRYLTFVRVEGAQGTGIVEQAWIPWPTDATKLYRYADRWPDPEDAFKADLRREEIAQLVEHLEHDHLLAITGPPGLGKSTLAAGFVGALLEPAHQDRYDIVFWYEVAVVSG